MRLWVWGRGVSRRCGGVLRLRRELVLGGGGLLGEVGVVMFCEELCKVHIIMGMA